VLLGSSKVVSAPVGLRVRTVGVYICTSVTVVNPRQPQTTSNVIYQSKAAVFMARRKAWAVRVTSMPGDRQSVIGKLRRGTLMGSYELM
jgi:hypothetical protein